MSNTPVLHLLHVPPDTRLLATWMVRYRTQDEGEALHGLLRAAFGTQAPQPFRYLDEQRGLLAYTALDGAALEQAKALADPQAARTLGLGAGHGHSGYRLRLFPSVWPQGKQLGFEVRVRPTVRGAKGEQDAFLHAVAAAGGRDGALVSREAVYATPRPATPALAGCGRAARRAIERLWSQPHSTPQPSWRSNCPQRPHHRRPGCHTDRPLASDRSSGIYPPAGTPHRAAPPRWLWHAALPPR